MRLFEYKNYKVDISEEALMLKPFKDIYKRDRTKNKDIALQELAYIYFMEDDRSDYKYIIDNEERSKAIIEGEGLDKWKPDKMVKDAQVFYSSFKPISSLLLEDTRVAVDKLRKLLRDIDLSQIDDKGRPVYTLNTITSTIKQIPALVKELKEAEKTVFKDTEEQGRAMGSNNKTLGDDGYDFLDDI